MMKRSTWLLAGILLLAAVIRCLFLDSRSIQYDDAFSVLLAGRSLPEIVRGTAADTMPPLYYFLLHFWLLLGQSLWFLRLLSVLLSLGIVWVLYHLTALTVSPRAGLWAAFLAAISPLQIYHAQDLRMYALLALTQLGYFYFFARILQRPTRRAFIGMVLCGAAAMYSHNLAIFGLAVAPLYLLLRRQWRLLGQVIAALAVVGLLALPWLGLIPGQVAKIQHAFWTPRPGIVEVLQAVLLFTTNLPLPGIWLAVGAVISVQLLVLVGMECWRSRAAQPGLALLAAGALLPPLLLFAASYAMRPVFVVRGFLMAALMYCALAGWAIARTWPRGVGVLIAAGFTAAAVIALPYQLTYREFPRSPFREAVTALQAQVQPGDLVLHENKLSAFPCLLYAPELPQVFLADEPGSSNDTLAPATQDAMQLWAQPDAAAAITGQRRVYLVVFQKTLADYARGGRGAPPALTWLEKNFTRGETQRFGDLQVIAFQR